MARFKQAVRSQARLRLGIDGPSGSGKSYTALRLAFAIPDARVAVIEAGENASMLLYEGEAPDGVPWNFLHAELKGNYAPGEYVAAIEDAAREGANVIIIDSLSHAWAGAGGALDQVGAAGFTDKDGWRKVTPQHNKMVDAILQSPCHVIATLRSKTEYVIENDDKGRSVPKKIGMAPIQRAGMEYEFTIYGSLDHSHTLTVTKSRCSAVQDAIVHKPGANFMGPVIDWMLKGVAVDVPDLPKRVSQEQLAKLGELMKQLKLTTSQVVGGLKANYGVDRLDGLTTVQAAELEQKLQARLDKQTQPAATNGVS